MGRRCTVCDHPKLDEIDMQLARGEDIAKIAQTFGVSDWALRRHQTNHLPPAIRPSPTAAEVLKADSILGELQAIRDRTISLLEKAEDAGTTKAYGPPSAYLKEIREQLKLMAELEGRLATQPQVNIYTSPQWREAGAALAEVLAPYPDLRVKAAAVFLQLEEGRRS